jgi:hypothetical protein
LEYIEGTGLGEVFRNKNITNLVDYVFGIEVGLDTNARKNRGGHNMSKAVSLFFDKYNVIYKKEDALDEECIEDCEECEFCSTLKCPVCKEHLCCGGCI